jgi:phage terminase large subunit-like protein
MASRKPYQEVVIVAADQDQSRDRVLRAIKFGVEHGPLAAHAKVFKDVIQLDNSSIIQAMPSDWRGAAGGNYSAVIFDELHSWVYDSSFADLTIHAQNGQSGS